MNLFTICKPFTLKRDLHEPDWDRFLLHSQYTKSLMVQVSDGARRTYQQLVSNSPPRTIFPNLTSVHFHLLEGIETRNSGFIRLFLPKSVSTVEIWAPPAAEGSLGAAIDALTGIELPGLVSFLISVAEFHRGPDLGWGVSQLLHAHRTIETLDIDMGHHQITEVLRSAGQLPALHDLEVIDYAGETAVREPEVLSLPDNLFPALRTLNLSGAPDFINALSSRVKSEDMERIKLYIDAYDRFEDFEANDATQVADCLLLTGRSSRLRTLDVELRISIPEDALNPVLACRELESLSIVVGWGCSLWLGENTLTRMGKAWPQLKTMNLTLFFGYHRSNEYMGLTHLQVIASEFPNLVKLTIGVDATKKGNPGFKFNVEDVVKIAGNKLLELDVGWSILDIDTKQSIASIFRAWWPNLQSVACEGQFPFSHHWESVARHFTNLFDNRD